MNNELVHLRAEKKGSIESVQNREAQGSICQRSRDQFALELQIGKWIFPLFSCLLL